MQDQWDRLLLEEVTGIDLDGNDNSDQNDSDSDGGSGPAVSRSPWSINAAGQRELHSPKSSLIPKKREKGATKKLDETRVSLLQKQTVAGDSRNMTEYNKAKETNSSSINY